MRRAFIALAAFLCLALGAWSMLQGPSIPAADSLPRALTAPATPLPGVTEVEGCAAPEELLALPEGVEVGPRQACCIDQCRTDVDCFFRCGGQPGQCVMNNPCCTECQCQVSSLSVAS